MRTTLLAMLMFFVCAVPSRSLADLDLEQEVLIIPDTHNEKPYIWHVQRDPHDYELTLVHKSNDGRSDQFLLDLKGNHGTVTGEMHVFITDQGLHSFAHVSPVKNSEGKYSFNFAPPVTGKYRFEVVFKVANGWVDLRKDVMLQQSGAKANDERPGDKYYDVGVGFYPKKIYADHVGTFLYQISYKGKPLKDIEKIGDADMQVAAWDEDLKEFIYVTPRQNLGGPEVAVSMVFMRPGKHAVFAEFKHNGIIRRVDFVVNVYEERSQNKGSLPNLQPSE